MSKRTLHSVTRSCNLELAPGIAVAETDTREVDTEMQADLRQPDQDNPLAEFFQ